ncbi:MAG: ThuA domain-containing protein [Ginsengibacter sp.]
MASNYFGLHPFYYLKMHPGSTIARKAFIFIILSSPSNNLIVMPVFFKINKIAMRFIAFYIACFGFENNAAAQDRASKFKVIAFYTARNDQAHISFVNEANKWFPKIAAANNFTYDSTNDWNNLNTEFLSHYQVVIFLDTRPDSLEQREAFQKYMEHGGAWMGFHFAGFALTPSDFPQNWDWYHNRFLGSGQYVSNTWRPVSAILRVEDRNHPATKNLPSTVRSSPSEWYRWEHDLRKNPKIDILLSIDSSSFPLGTGPKPNEIWHSGYYPVVWTNKDYKMIYFNMGHNDIDYEHKFDSTNKTLSYTFNNEMQDKLITDALLWLGSAQKVPR